MKKSYFLQTIFTTAILGVGFFASAQDANVKQVEINRELNSPSFIQFEIENTSYRTQDVQYVFKKHLGLRQNADELKVLNSTTTSGNVNIIRYQQYYKGIKVEHGN